METKPYSLQAPEQIAKEYGGNKRAIAQAAQQGMLDPTAAILAGMFIDRMRNAASTEQAPTQTVAQDVMAPPQMPQGQMPPQMGMPSQPPMGLPDIPIPENMYEPSYAGGGIVAFEDGGGVRKFQFGGGSFLSPYDVATASVDDLIRLASFGDESAARELSKRNPPSKFNFPGGQSGAGVGPSTAQVTDQFRSGVKPGVGIGPSTPQVTDQFRVSRGLAAPSVTPASAASAAAPSTISRILDIGKKTFKPVFAADLLTTASEIDPKNTEANTLSKLKYIEYNAAAMSPEQLKISQQLLTNPQANVADLHKVLTTQVAGPSGSEQTAQANGGVPTPPAPFVAPTAPTSFLDVMAQAKKANEQISPKAETIPSVADSVAAEKEAMTAAGFDFNLVKNQIANIRAEKEQSKTDRKDAANLRLIEAGLGIMSGESPHAFVNIGRGAAPALRGLSDDIKEIKKIDRERDKAMRDLAVAENQIAAGVGSSAMKRRDAAQDRIVRAEENRANREINLATNINSNETQRYVAQLNLQSAQEGRSEARRDTLLRSAREQARRQVESMVRNNPSLQDNTQFDYEGAIDSLERQILQQWGLSSGSPTSGSAVQPRGKVVNGVYIPAGR